MASIAVQIDQETGEFTNICSIRELEYPQLKGITYLDHAGTTLYAKSLIDACSNDLKSHLFGNPHSGAESSQRSSKRIEETRHKLLQYFNAPPDDFDVVFVANATAAIKLVAEAFRDNPDGFDYAYHIDCHNSVVGVRELAKRSSCLSSHVDIDAWLRKPSSLPWTIERPRLLAFPGQSNLTGYRPDLRICSTVRQSCAARRPIYTLLDAAALVSTSQLDLSDAGTAPDFTALSLYKIFGYPDLGALIVRKQSADILLRKKYFAGGTVDIVTVDDPWHVRSGCIHEALEEGTLAFHNIIALSHALDTHARLYGSPVNVSRHARYLANLARSRLLALRHANGSNVCQLYGSDSESHGPVIAFNLLDPVGRVFRTSVVEMHAIDDRIHCRRGGMCNPGGIERHLNITSADVKDSYRRGIKCADDTAAPEDFHGAIGMVRVSFGAMSASEDVDRLLEFVSMHFRDQIVGSIAHMDREATFNVESDLTLPESTSSTLSDVYEKGSVWSEAPSRGRQSLRRVISCFR